MTATPQLEEGQELLGEKQGFKPNRLMRENFLARGGGKAKAIELISLLEARGGRTTLELCRELEIPHKKLAAIVDIARKFEHAHENGDIRAIRDESNGRLWYYWLIYDPSGLIGRALDTLQRAAGLIGSGRKIMDVLSAHSLKGEEEEARALLGEVFAGFEGVTQVALGKLAPMLPSGSVEQSKLNAKAPTHEEMGVPKEGALVVKDEPDDIWSVARKKAKESGSK